MSDLVAFLTARLDEDERVARAAAKDAGSARDDGARWYHSDLGDGVGNDVTGGLVAIGPWGGGLGDVGPHIARWDPGRVLAEVEAKRILLRQVRFMIEYRGFLRTGGALATDACPENWRACGCDNCWEVYALLRPYADHPDYDPAWKVAD